LVREFQNLKYLILKWNKLPSGSFDLLKNSTFLLSTLTCLVIEQNKLNTGDMIVINEMKSLRILHLYDTFDENIEIFTESSSLFETLKRLEIVGVKITEEVKKRFSNFNQLKHLKLRLDSSDICGLHNILNNEKLQKNLRFLNISYNSNALCSEILSKLEKLTILHISFMNISREELNKFVGFFKNNKSLGWLNIRGNDLNETDLLALENLPSRVKCLTSSYGFMFSTEKQATIQSKNNVCHT
jgi:hypothetical protein